MTPLIQHPSSWLRIPSFPPGWDGMHPWMVHCPMALFLTVPVFVFLAMILFQRGRWMSLTALVLLGLGLLGASLSVSTGLAARDYLDQSSVKISDAAADVLQKHQQLGSTIVPLYGVLFIVYLVLFILSLLVRPFDHPVWIFFMNLIFLILLLVAGLVLVNTGELGGRLVHEFGIHGRIREGVGPGKPTPPVQEKPSEQKPVPPTQEKAAEEKPTPPETPKEKPSEEKSTPPTQEKPTPPTQEKPSEEKPSPSIQEKPSKEKSTSPVQEKPSEEKPSSSGQEKPPSAPSKEKSSETKENIPPTTEEKTSEKERKT